MGDVDQLLDQALQLGLIEVVGITPKGNWLYGPTRKAEKILAIEDLVLAIQELTDCTEE